MEKYYETLISCELFKNLTASQIEKVLKSMGTKIHSYKKSEYIYFQGQTISSIGIILTGSAIIISTDFLGNDSIYSALTSGDMFGEALFALNDKKMPFNVLSSTDCEILFIEHANLLGKSLKTDEQNIIIKNLLCILAEKTLKFRQTIEHVTRRTTRQKVLSYLSSVAKAASSSCFEIPFNRQQLADYLAVERSALSAELSKMKKEGIIDYQKNRFKLIKNS